MFLSNRPFKIYFIFIFLLVSFLLTSITSYELYKHKEAFTIGDWLINYQGGFVRRGLLGEVIINLSYLTNLNPGLITSYTHMLFYFLFFLFSFLAINQQNNLKNHWILIFSPFLFYFQIFDFYGGFRKEIIFFSIFAFLVWSFNKFEEKTIDKIFFTTLVFYSFLILSHEIFIFFLPYILVAYLLKVEIEKKRLIYLTLCSLPSLICFVFSILNPGDREIVEKIFLSLENQNYKMSGGAIEWLMEDRNHGINTVKEYIEKFNYVSKYSVIILLSLLAYYPLREIFKKIAEKKINLIMFFLPLFGTFLISYMAVDWGRFIYINLVSIFFISLIKIDSYQNQKIIFSWYLLVPLSIIYFSFWQIPHCCNFFPLFNNELTTTNIFKLIKFLSQFANNYI